MKCFVIMPYGKDESEKKEYGRVYKFLIRSAAEDLGLECYRSDIEGKGGHILGNVVEDLSTSDVVVADISDFNWNVAYELGMRHVLHKNGTILMCNNAYKKDLPFDIQSLNILFYPSDWLDSMEEQCELLKKAIEARLSGKTQIDSPVHEKYSYLPNNIVTGFAESTDDSLIAAKERIAQLEKEISDTNKKIESMGLSLNGAASDSENIDYSDIFITELSNSIYNSDAAIARMRELISEGDKEGFLKFLGKVLSVGFLDEIDCRNAYVLCKRLEVPAITRKYLEAVTRFYPENDDLSGFLANEYSRNYHTGEKALQMVNGIIGVSKKDGHYALSKTVKITTGKLASFFDVYLHLNKYQELVEIGLLLAERLKGQDKVLCSIYRNMTSAYLHLGDYENARIYKELLEKIAPYSDITHLICARYENATENYSKVIEEIETCINLDSEDIDYYVSMAGYICDNLFVRDPDDFEIKRISSREADQYALPFLITALTLDRSAITRVIDFLRRNNFNSYIEAVHDAYQSGIKDFRVAFTELDYGAVDYCFKKSI